MSSAVALANLGRQAGFRDDRGSADPTRASELAVITAIALTDRRIAARLQADAQAVWDSYSANGRRFGRGSASGSACMFSVYCSRTYLVNLPRAEAAVRGTNRPSVVQQNIGGATNVVDGIKSIGDAVVFFVKVLVSPNLWIRFGEVIAGGILVMFGLWVLVGETRLGNRVESNVKTAATAAIV